MVAQARLLGKAIHRSKLKFLNNEEIRLLRKRFGISQRAFSKFFHASWITISRWERSRAVPSQRAQRTLARLKELSDVALGHLTNKEFKIFLLTPHPDLYGDSPIDVISTELGYRAVRDILQDLLSGEYF